MALEENEQSSLGNILTCLSHGEVTDRCKREFEDRYRLTFIFVYVSKTNEHFFFFVSAAYWLHYPDVGENSTTEGVRERLPKIPTLAVIKICLFHFAGGLLDNDDDYFYTSEGILRERRFVIFSYVE